MNFRKLLIMVLVLGIALFAFSGCTAMLLVLGYSYLTDVTEPTEPSEPTLPDITDPKPNNFHSIKPIT